MLHIDHFSLTYPGGKTAVKDLSLHVRPGEIFGFIGHNGAGKTTTLRAAAGVLDFSEGTISIDGHDVRREAIAAKSVTAFLPDNPDLYDFYTGIQFLNLIADLYRIPKDVREARIAEYAGAFRMTGDLGSAIGGYSHGMKQKLALISALMRRPRLLILDEPFVGLDPEASHLLKGFLAQLCADGGAVFFSTHVLEVAERLCHRIAIIRDGSLVRVGPTAEVVGDSTLEQVFLDLAERGKAMDRFLPLLRLNLRTMLSAFQFGRSRRRAVSGVGAALFLCALMLYLSGTYSFLFASQLAPLDLLELLFLLMPVMAVGAGGLFTLFSAQGMLFAGRDNDLMLAMPVPPSTLLLSRLAAVWLENLMLTLFVLLPAGAAWLWYGGGGGLRMALTLVLCTPLLALLPTACSVAAGFLLSALTGRLRKSALWNNLLYLAFVAAVLALSLRLNFLLTDLTAFAVGLTEDLSPLLVPFLWMERAVCLGDPGALALFAAVCVLPMALLTAALSPRYRAVLSRSQSRGAGAVYRPKSLRASGVRAALIKKEARKLWNTPIYLFNAGFGSILLLASGLAAPFFRGTVQEYLAAAPGLPMAPLTALSLCAMTGMGAVSGSSISLEGKCLWLLKSSPLSVRDIFAAKISFALLVLVPPALLSAPGMGWALGLSPAECALAALAGASAGAFAAPFGLFVNLCFPKLDAPNDQVVVKQSAASMISVLGGMLACGAACVPPLLLWGRLGVWALLIPTAALLALAGLFTFLLARVGEGLFRAL